MLFDFFSFSLLLVWEDFEIYHELSLKWLMILALGNSERVFYFKLKEGSMDKLLMFRDEETWPNIILNL